MARTFSTSFSYKNYSYTALVTIRSDAISPISVYVPDTSLHSLLPQGKLMLDEETNWIRNNNYDACEELIDSIIASVKRHEEDKPERSLWN